MGRIGLSPSDFLLYAFCVAIIVLALMRLAGVR
jgi:hypothetical protein